MIELPPIPSWDGLHPLVVHFPVALLLVAPLFVLLGALLGPQRGRPFLVTALLLLFLGSVGTFVAVGTGEAAGRLADRSAAINAVLERHEELAEATRAVFSVLTLILASILIVPRLLKRELSRGAAGGLLAAFLVAYGAGSVLLANTAHNGGRLVHELGVRALTSPSPAATAASATSSTEAKHEGEHED